jgi:hypothetical protein
MTAQEKSYTKKVLVIQNITKIKKKDWENDSNGGVPKHLGSNSCIFLSQNMTEYNFMFNIF